jgi:hypothetical protein
MQPYVIRQGDYLLKLAYSFGFDAEAVWNDDKNADLRSQRQDPNTLLPGDILSHPSRKHDATSPFRPVVFRTPGDCVGHWAGSALAVATHLVGLAVASGACAFHVGICTNRSLAFQQTSENLSVWRCSGWCGQSWFRSRLACYSRNDRVSVGPPPFPRIIEVQFAR